eukprot:m51a1_g4328 hypothetical protein (296) ;mRNA; f:99650-101385
MQVKTEAEEAVEEDGQLPATSFRLSASESHSLLRMQDEAVLRALRSRPETFGSAYRLRITDEVGVCLRDHLCTLEGDEDKAPPRKRRAPQIYTSTSCLTTKRPRRSTSSGQDAAAPERRAACSDSDEEGRLWLARAAQWLATARTAGADLLRKLLESQERRVGVYAAFQLALDTLLESGDLEAYRASCQSITGAFSAASADVRATEQELRGAGRADLGDMVRRLQDAERSKLHLTARMHVVLTQEKFPQQRDEEYKDEHVEEEKGLLGEELESVTAIACSVLEDIHAELADLTET